MDRRQPERLEAVETARVAYLDWSPKSRRDSLDLVLVAVCDVTRTDIIEVASDRRFAHLIPARFLWWACLREYFGMTYMEIGDFVNRDYSTVIRGSKLVPRHLLELMAPLMPMPFPPKVGD